MDMRRRFAAAKVSLTAAAVFATIGSAPAWAFKINTGNPDLNVNFDTTVRYNLGWRMEGVNRHFANAFGHDETETVFKKHDLITNRLDLLTEFDVSVRSKYGFRVSAALWSENAYSGKSRTASAINQAFGPFAPTPNNGPGGKYSSYTKRYVTGSSGEFLDAFVYNTFNIGSTSLTLRAGQHNVYWGESMFTTVDGIAAGQGPLDTIKGQANPGSEAKELFLPLKQVSGQWTLTPEVSVLAQYLFDWKPLRATPGATFFASSDASGDLLGSDPMCASVAPAGTCIRSLDAVTPKRNRGNFGLGMHWSPTWLEGTLGLYYRKYDEKLPWASMQLQGNDPQNPANLGLRMAYARDTEMFGVSLARNFWGLSTGLEVSYRRNTALNSINGFFAGSQNNTGVTQVAPGVFVPSYFLSPEANIPLSQTPTYSQLEGARGNTFHVVFNAIKLLNKTPLWETGDMAFELAYQRLDKVTKNRNVYYSVDHACKSGFLPGGVMPGTLGESDGCASRDSLVFSMNFNPKWMEVRPGLDLIMPISISYGVHGNSPTLGGSYEGAYRWSIGLRAIYRTLYEFSVRLSDQHQDYKTKTATTSNGVPGATIYSTSQGQSPVQNSHRWLGVTFKTTF